MGKQGCGPVFFFGVRAGGPAAYRPQYILDRRRKRGRGLALPVGAGIADSDAAKGDGPFMGRRILQDAACRQSRRKGTGIRSAGRAGRKGGGPLRGRAAEAVNSAGIRRNWKAAQAKAAGVSSGFDSGRRGGLGSNSIFRRLLAIFMEFRYDGSAVQQKHHGFWRLD